MPFAEEPCEIEEDLYSCNVDPAKLGPELNRCLGKKANVRTEDYVLFVSTEYRIQGVLITLDDDGLFEVATELAKPAASGAKIPAPNAATTKPVGAPPQATDRSAAAPSGGGAK
jgi:hypothetical protein